MREKIFEKIIKYRIFLMIVFIACTIVAAYCKQFISVNYDLHNYLPKDVNSTVSLELMEAEFEGAIPNARVAVKNVSYKEALSYKQKISEVDGIEDVSWLDDTNIFDVPIKMLPADTVEKYYKDGTALFSVTITKEKISDAVFEIRNIIGEQNAMTGSAVCTAVATASTITEIQKIAIVAVIIVLILLILTTTSWIDPIIILVGIGVAVTINAGSNIIFGEISFVTNAAGSILQLAVSLDYSVFLIHRFHECIKVNRNPAEAMKNALCKSMTSILSSGLTTVIGFLALVLMRFRIGQDLGLALAKGIVISLLTVFMFMPGVILLCYKLMDKTAHKPFVPSFAKFGKFVSKITIPVTIVFLLIIAPSYYMSSHNEFYYGATHIFGVGTQYGDDTKFIEDTFGITDTYVMMVPCTDDKKEAALADELSKVDKVSSVTSLADIAGPAIPVKMLPDSIVKRLRSDNYSRILIEVNAEYDGKETFELVKKIRAIGHSYYDECYLAGQGVSTYDLMDTVTADMVKVNLAAIGAVFLVLIISLKSIVVPVILVLAIETAIWANLSIPFIKVDALYYIVYLIISSIQLGATVDYAILFSDRYKENRVTLQKKDSIVETIKQVMVSVLTSGLALVTVGFLLGKISTHGLLSQLGYMLGQGGICSLVSVLFVLPGLLYLTDRKKNKV